MKIIDKIKGKEVIDSEGNIVGNVVDFDWNKLSKKVESFVVVKGGASAKIGMGTDLYVSLDYVSAIGENILLNDLFKELGVHKEEKGTILEAKDQFKTKINETGKQIKIKAEEAEEKLDETGQQIKTKIDQTQEQAKEKTEATKIQIQEKAKQAEEKLDETGQQIKTKIDQTQEQAKEKTEATKIQIQEKAEEAEEKLDETGQQIKTKIDQTQEQAKEKLEETKDNIKSESEKKPVKKLNPVRKAQLKKRPVIKIEDSEKK